MIGQRRLLPLLVLSLLIGCEPSSDSPENTEKNDASQKASPEASDETKKDNPSEKEDSPKGSSTPDPSQTPKSENESPSPEESEEEPSENEDSSSSGEDSDSTPSSESNDESSTDDSGEESSEEPEPGEDPCDKIQWGVTVKIGAVVPRGDTPGFWDKDKDNKLDEGETQVGMCELHKTGKKCAIVIFGKEN